MARENTIQPLHPIEKALLKALSSFQDKDRWVALAEASQKSGSSIDQTRRAVEWLKEKGLLTSKEEETTTFALGSKGAAFLSGGLPERRLVSILEMKSGSLDLSELRKALGEDFTFALGKS